jgi:hypothetical protein
MKSPLLQSREGIHKSKGVEITFNICWHTPEQKGSIFRLS